MVFRRSLSYPKLLADPRVEGSSNPAPHIEVARRAKSGSVRVSCEKPGKSLSLATYQWVHLRTLILKPRTSDMTFRCQYLGDNEGDDSSSTEAAECEASGYP